MKIDLLGNRSLAVIRDAIAAVHGNTGRLIDYTSSDAGEDEATRALFRTGQTMGVFYTESPASRALCAKSRAETFDLLVLNTSIIRPASNRYIRTYLERLHGAPYEPLHPVLRDTLAETFGVMVYQEDVVNVCAVFAGMPLATADGLRKSLSKKRPAKQLAGYAEEFFAGAAGPGPRPRDDQAGVGDDHVVRRLQLLQGALGVATSRWRSTPATSGRTIRRSSWRRCSATAAGSITRSPTSPRRCGWGSRSIRPT